jgi:hypothetical protein|tara:strand:+ start:46 stop:297 length:252 start_codon:yes stop_codon:yes gene_type:complete
VYFSNGGGNERFAFDLAFSSLAFVVAIWFIVFTSFLSSSASEEESDDESLPLLLLELDEDVEDGIIYKSFCFLRFFLSLLLRS